MTQLALKALVLLLTGLIAFLTYWIGRNRGFEEGWDDAQRSARRDECERDHVEHWFGYECDPASGARFHMHCVQCGRWWAADYNEQPDPVVQTQNSEKYRKEVEYAMRESAG